MRSRMVSSLNGSSNGDTIVYTDSLEHGPPVDHPLAVAQDDEPDSLGLVPESKEVTMIPNPETSE